MAEKNNKKKPNNGHTFKKIIKFMRPWLGLFIAMCIFSLLAAVFSVLAPNYMKNIVIS